MTDRCVIPGCLLETGVVYLDHNVCQIHWEQFTAEHQPADALARALGMPVATATTMEKTMSEETTTETETETKPVKATKSTKKTKAVAKPAKKAKPAKEPKPKKEKAPKREPPPRVFAFRLDDAELAAIHATAGARNASRFIRAVAAAFAAEDVAAFNAILREAREARS